MRTSVLMLAGLAALTTIGCKKADAPAAAPPAASPAPAAASAPTTPAGPAADTTTMTRKPSGIFVKDITVGTGPAARAGQLVRVHYVGTLMDGRQFDANVGSTPPMAFHLAAHEMIAGFDEGVTGMKVGGKRMVVLPPALAYGTNGNGPVPPNATLVFTIELVSAQ